MPDETAHGLEVSRSCNLCEGLVRPSRIRLICPQIHLDQSLITTIVHSGGRAGGATDSFKDRDPLTTSNMERAFFCVWKYANKT